MSIPGWQSLAFWRGLALGLGIGLLAGILLLLTPSGTKRPSAELRAFEAIGELVEDGCREDLASVLQHFGKGAQTNSVPLSPRAEPVIALLEDLEPPQRRGILLWLQAMPWGFGGDS